MGLLVPSIDELASIPFESVSVAFSENGKPGEILATRRTNDLIIRASPALPPLIIDNSVLDRIDMIKRQEGNWEPFLSEIAKNETHRYISAISKPMFLGLERRQYCEVQCSADSSVEAAYREILLRRSGSASIRPSIGTIASGLSDVLKLFRAAMTEVRQKQEVLDKDLREKLLLSAVQYRPTDLSKFEIPSRQALEKFKESADEVRRAAANLRLPVERVQTSLDEFFLQMSKLITHFENYEKHRNAVVQKTDAGKQSIPVEESHAILNWMANQGQVTQILSNLKEMEMYSKGHQELRTPVNRFLNLVNDFLVQTGKQLEVSDNDELSVALHNGTGGSVFTLSSGERQLVVMLGQLSFNPQLLRSGVFVVDEPELSLHVSWQRKFVSAIRRANPAVQLILATHSPEIILGMEENCRSLSEGRDA
jgi:predicted ATPase